MGLGAREPQLKQAEPSLGKSGVTGSSENPPCNPTEGGDRDRVKKSSNLHSSKKPPGIFNFVVIFCYLSEANVPRQVQNAANVNSHLYLQIISYLRKCNGDAQGHCDL